MLKFFPGVTANSFLLTSTARWYNCVTEIRGCMCRKAVQCKTYIKSALARVAQLVGAWTERLWVPSSVRAHKQIVSSIPLWGMYWRQQINVSLSYWCFYSLSLSLSLSKQWRKCPLKDYFLIFPRWPETQLFQRKLLVSLPFCPDFHVHSGDRTLWESNRPLQGGMKPLPWKLPELKVLYYFLATSVSFFLRVRPSPASLCPPCVVHPTSCVPHSDLWHIIHTSVCPTGRWQNRPYLNFKIFHNQ